MDGMTIAHLPLLAGPSAGPAQHARWRRLRVDGRAVEVVTVGAGTPVLFLHGWGLSPRSYLPSLRALARRGFAVTAVSLPGFGHSDAIALGEQNVDGVAGHVAAVVDLLGFTGPVDVVGHSFGGGVAMRLAAIRPDLIRSLTLVCPVGGAGEGAVPLLRMVAGVVIDARHRWIGRAAHDLLGAAFRHPGAVVATAYAAWQSDQLDDLARIDRNGTPVRFLFADHDEVVTPGRIPACAFTHVTCEVLAGRHSWLITDPALFADKVQSGLAVVPVLSDAA